ncbi:hypothetical protein Z947_2992 [Sulfitobacter geojensis]|nr:hypothetical protein Z947_2992 [Sulfitobacter geojensis]
MAWRKLYVLWISRKTGDSYNILPDCGPLRQHRVFIKVYFL